MKRNKWLFLLLLITIIACAGRPPVKKEEAPISILQPDFITIIAVGDNLYHSNMIRDGEEGDYNTAYREISGLVKKADIAFVNQETLLAGREFGFSGYPLFNSPQKLGRSISEAGFNIVNHASNHIMDKGEKAVFATMDFWDTIPGVSVLGIHRSEERRSLPLILRKNNITVGFLSYTYGTNGISIPKDKPFLVSLINTEIMAKEIDALRPLCDFLIVSMHWGEEFKHETSKNQKALSAFLAEHYVDLVIGHHPHVIQPIEYIQRPDNKNMLCYYSLGNLISAHNQYQEITLLGAMAFIKIEKSKNPAGPDDAGINAASIRIAKAGAIPLVTHYEKNYSAFKVYPLFAYSEELALLQMANQGKDQLSPLTITAAGFKETAAGIFGDKEIKGSPF
jgi:poly-gamma-glutamate synthesis protein (capsule biosynthesis protein)